VTSSIQAAGPAAVKARRPNMERRYRGVADAPDEQYLRCGCRNPSCTVVLFAAYIRQLHFRRNPARVPPCGISVFVASMPVGMRDAAMSARDADVDDATNDLSAAEQYERLGHRSQLVNARHRHLSQIRSDIFTQVNGVRSSSSSSLSSSCGLSAARTRGFGAR